METRLVVAGHNEMGGSQIVSDSKTEQAFASFPGFSSTLLWATEGIPEVGVGQSGGVDSRSISVVPTPGGTRLLVVTLPPDAEMKSPSFDGAAWGAELTAKAPGLAEAFDPNDPGMHRTDTVDYGVILDGEVWLELDDRQPVRLGRSDVVIQNGTRHAWRNRSARSSTVLFVLIGAQRKED